MESEAPSLRTAAGADGHQHGQDSATRSLGVWYLKFRVDVIVTLNPKPETGV